MEIISEKRYVDGKKPNRLQKVAIAVARTRASRRDSCDSSNFVKDKSDWRKKPYIAVSNEINGENACVSQQSIDSNQSKSSMYVFSRRKIETLRFESKTVANDVPNARNEVMSNNKIIESDVQKLALLIKERDHCRRSVSMKSSHSNEPRIKARVQKPVNANIPASSDIVLAGRVVENKAVDGKNGCVDGNQQVCATAKDKRSPTMELRRRKSTAAVSLYDEELTPLYMEGKRRNSMSALVSLSLGEMQLSPFRRNSPVCKRGSTNKKHSSRRLLDLPLPLTEDEMSRSGRKVAFVVQSDGSIQTDIAESNLSLSEDEVKTLWWSKPERRAMKRKAQKIAIKFLSVTAKYHLAVEQILSHCGNNIKNDRHAYFSEREALRFLIHHDARGLELAMISSLSLPSCKVYHKSCKNSVKEVLNTQAMWKCSTVKSVDELVHMIAAQYHQASAIATQFARTLAEGDQRVARGAYVKMDQTDEASILTPALTEESSLSTFSSASDEDFSDGSFTI